MSDSLGPHEWQHARPPCPLPTPEFTQTRVLRVGDAIQPSHPLSSPSPPAPNPSQHQGLFQWVNSSHELANVYAGQEATVRTGQGTTDWFQIGKGVHQGCILSHCLFNLYAEYIMWNAGLEEAQAGFKIAGRNINNLRDADDTTLMAESEEELKSFLMKVKEESEKMYHYFQYVIRKIYLLILTSLIICIWWISVIHLTWSTEHSFYTRYKISSYILNYFSLWNSFQVSELVLGPQSLW